MKRIYYKVGDKIIIKKRPRYWSSVLSNKNPISDYSIIEYPYTCEIVSLNIGKCHTAMKDNNGYGWDMNSMIEDDCLYNIREERRNKLSKLNETRRF